MASDERAAGIMRMDPLGIAGMPMALGSQQGPMGDMGAGAGAAGEGDGDKASPSKVCGKQLCCSRPVQMRCAFRLPGRGSRL